MTDSHDPHEPATQLAVVVGLCAHGLALVRALRAEGVSVVALEANSELPGFRTGLADVRHVEDINGPRLIDSLESLAHELPARACPVLHITNDNMVRVVAHQWERLASLYRLSWGHCRDEVLRLLDKSGLEAHCRAHDLPYPRSWLLRHADDLDGYAAELAYPLIAKPTRPLSGFKVRLVETESDLRTLMTRYPSAMPLLLQQWIRGGDQQLLFVAFYLDHGRILATFGGRKLESDPPAMGQTTVAEPFNHELTRELGERFFAPLGLSGPVSLEVKLDPAGTAWVVEPTVGRTDYWLDCCVANGVNFPAIEQAHQTGHALPRARQTHSCVWFDTERAPACYLRYRLRGNHRSRRALRARFPYWVPNDPGPFRKGILRQLKGMFERVRRRLRG